MSNEAAEPVEKRIAQYVKETGQKSGPVYLVPDELYREACEKAAHYMGFFDDEPSDPDETLCRVLFRNVELVPLSSARGRGLDNKPKCEGSK